MWTRRSEAVWMREGCRWGEEAWQLASGHLGCGCGRGALLLHRRRGVEARRREQPVVGGRSWPGKWL